MIQTGKAETRGCRGVLPSKAVGAAGTSQFGWGNGRLLSQDISTPWPHSSHFPGLPGALRKGIPSEKGGSHPILLPRRRAGTELGEGQSMGKKMWEVKGDLPGKELREPGRSWVVSVYCSYVGCRVENLQPGGGR